MKRLLKWVGGIVAGVVALVAVFLVATYFISESKLNATYQIAVNPLDVSTDSATVARGEHLVQILSCQECHGAQLAGTVFVDAPPFRVVATNLTSGAGGVGAYYDDAAWDRALRHGVDYRGQSLVLMPSQLFHNLSDEDAAAVIAYLKTLPPVDNVLPETELRVIGRPIVAMTGGILQADLIDHARPAPTAEPGATAAYGAYLASVSCIECHGADLRGGMHPSGEGPPVPGLEGVKDWSRDDFARTVRTGNTPDGRQLDGKLMPWRFYQHLTDEEVDALYAHLQTL